MLEDEVIILGAAGGQTEVSGQQFWQREGLGAKVFQLHSLSSILSGYIHLKVGGAYGEWALLLSLHYWLPG